MLALVRPFVLFIIQFFITKFDSHSIKGKYMLIRYNYIYTILVYYITFFAFNNLKYFTSYHNS